MNNQKTNWSSFGTNNAGASQQIRQNRSYGSYSTQDTVQYSELPDFNIGEISKELFDSTAKKCAQVLANKKNTGTQLRRFYDELVMWYDRAMADEEDNLENILPFIYMINSKVAYAKGRKNVDEKFQRYMEKLIRQIKDKKTLKNAKLFMEAMMGFFKELVKD